MDQVITYIGRFYQSLYGDDCKGVLSASMINNYVKAKLLPRPVGKKYGREQIALLCMIVALKPVCSMDDIRRLLTPSEGESVEALYEAFYDRFSQGIQSLSTDAPAPLSPALNLAISAAACRAGCDAALAGEITE